MIFIYRAGHKARWMPIHESARRHRRATRKKEREKGRGPRLESPLPRGKPRVVIPPPPFDASWPAGWSASGDVRGTYGPLLPFPLTACVMKYLVCEIDSNEMERLQRLRRRGLQISFPPETGKTARAFASPPPLLSPFGSSPSQRVA